MASYSVKYQIVHNGKPPSGASITSVTADSISEARQKFKYSHVDNGTTKYKIVAVVKRGG
jgi:hypothetical protein